MLRCPVCRSRELYLLSGGYTGYIYRCKHCGYEGSLVVDVDGDLEEKDDGSPNHGKTE
ncbi:MAG: hypothetical protein QHG99_07425 [Methanomicrobiales archaeon]|nr:hypothetical protein [Methanomicrobiales archaeon]